MFAFFIMILSENMKKSNDSPRQNSLDQIIHGQRRYAQIDTLHFIFELIINESRISFYE